MSLVYYHDMEDYVNNVRAFAEKIGLRDQLESRLSYLANYGDGKTRCRLYKDFAKYSFVFIIDELIDGDWKVRLGGGLIYHGPEQGETLTVTLDDNTGWSIHT